jgi:hypothetical protein
VACGPGLFCAEKLCVPPPILDMPCAAAPDRVPYCSLGLACDMAPFVSALGTCVLRKGEGEACAYHWSCRPGLVCAGLDWTPFPSAPPVAGMCAPPLGEGGECSPSPSALWVGDECAQGLSCDEATRRCRRLARQGEACSLQAQDCVGAAIACYESALEYAKSRIQFKAPLASFQLVQAKLAGMLTEITKAQLLCLRLGRLKDEGRARHSQISMAKMNNAREALEIARAARDILGANGISLGYPPIRHMLNLETVNTYEGTEDIHKLSIGRDITGMNAFSRDG